MTDKSLYHDDTHAGLDLASNYDGGSVFKVNAKLVKNLQYENKAKQREESLRKNENTGDNVLAMPENGIILPLSDKCLDLFTKMPAPSLKAIRTDTVSTILEQDEFDSENQGSTAAGNTNFSIANELDEIIPSNLEKFRVLALSRVEEDIRGVINPNEGVGRRSSNKVENWDLIYTESNGNQFTKKCNENVVSGRGINSKTSGILCDKHNECLLPDIPLDARKATTLRRHYYPEGGWGWVVIVCTVLVHVINHGLQLTCSQLTNSASEQFKAQPVQVAGFITELGIMNV